MVRVMVRVRVKVMVMVRVSVRVRVTGSDLSLADIGNPLFSDGDADDATCVPKGSG